MQIAKKWIDAVMPEDTKHQCEKHAGCHRKKGHDGPCVTLARAVAENIEQGAMRMLRRLRGAS